MAMLLPSILGVEGGKISDLQRSCCRPLLPNGNAGLLRPGCQVGKLQVTGIADPSVDEQTLQVFIDGRSYRLAELGSGLAQFILVLANVATRQPAYVLIDEPELNLHPLLQLDFLTTLASYASEGVLFATHSIGLARACADYVYSVRKIAEGKSEIKEIEATPRLSEFLGELSFSGYRELGFNKMALW